MSAIQSLKNSFTYTGMLFILQGLLLLLFPNVPLKLMFLKPLETAQAEQYARILGLGVVVIGYFFCIAGKHTLIEFYRASIMERVFVVPVIIAVVYFYSLEVQFLAFAVVDMVTAFWSYTCLKAYDAEQAKLKK